MCACMSYLHEVKTESLVAIVRILQHVAQLYPSHMPSLLLPVLPMILTDLFEEEASI